MKKRLITLLVLIFPICLFAQDKTIIRYFDANLKHERKENRAR